MLQSFAPTSFLKAGLMQRLDKLLGLAIIGFGVNYYTSPYSNIMKHVLCRYVYAYYWKTWSMYFNMTSRVLSPARNSYTRYEMKTKDAQMECVVIKAVYVRRNQSGLFLQTFEFKVRSGERKDVRL